MSVIVRLEICVVELSRPIIQYYEIPRGGMALLIYGGNIPKRKADELLDLELIGALTENNGLIGFFPIYEEKSSVELNVKAPFKIQHRNVEITITEIRDDSNRGGAGRRGGKV